MTVKGLGSVTSSDGWVPVCRVDQLEIDRGATALVHGQAIAIFRLGADRVYALGNHDPFARAGERGEGIIGGLAKGIVALRNGVPMVGSPSHRHGFDLQTGACLDDPHIAVPAYGVRIADGTVLVGPRVGVDQAG